MKPSNTKLLPSDRTALAKLRLQEKMAAKKQNAENKNNKNNNDDDDNGNASSSSESSTDEEERSRRKRNTFGSLNEEDGKKTAATAKKAPPKNNSVAKKATTSPPAVAAPAKASAPSPKKSVSSSESKPTSSAEPDQKKEVKKIDGEKQAKKEQKPKAKKTEEKQSEAATITLALPKSRSAASSAIAENNNTTSTPTASSPLQNNNENEISNTNGNAIIDEIVADVELNGENDEEEKEEEENAVDANDEFNLVKHHHHHNESKKKDTKKNASSKGAAANGNDDDDDDQQQPQASPQQWQDHGVLLSEQEHLEKCPPQHFDYFLLIDFECSCDESPGWDLEVIEIPALLYDTKKLEVVAEFHTYVKPLRNTELTPFCKQLTGIQQEQVENAPCYDEALKSLVNFVQTSLANLAGSPPSSPSSSAESAQAAAGRKTADGSRLCVATDGPCDLEVFGYLFMHVRDGFAFPNFFQRYIDVKQVYRDEYGEGKYYKIKDMLQRFGLKFQGHQHSGIDDTRNLATIVTQMIKRGTIFEEVNYVSNVTGKRKVPAYIWNKARETVKRAQMSGRVGKGPLMADRCRQGLLGLSEGEVRRRAANKSGFDLVALIRKFALVRIKVRSSEFMNAPSTGLLILMLVVFVASILLRMSSGSTISVNNNNNMVVEP